MGEARFPDEVVLKVCAHGREFGRREHHQRQKELFVYAKKKVDMGLCRISAETSKEICVSVRILEATIRTTRCMKMRFFLKNIDLEGVVKRVFRAR